jgi:membrane protein implicated in regulation of membrane protease activity
VMPGSGRRVAYLLVALVLVQIVCPLLFTNGVQWWVSGGLVAGYGVVLYWQLRQRLSQGK